MPVIPPQQDDRAPQVVAKVASEVETTTESQSRPVRLLLTGFGPFMGITDNPSMLIGRRLADELITSEPIPLATDDSAQGETTSTTAAALQQGVGTARADHASTSGSTAATVSSSKYRVPHPSNRPVQITFQELRVSYSEVQSMVQEIHQSGEWDVVVHMGVAMGYKECTMETGSDRVGYDVIHPDVDGRFPPVVRGGHGLEGEVDRWDSVVSTADLLAFLRHDKHVKRIRESPDPGGYLCGFSYATSLKWADIAAKERESPPRPVLFVHVPGLRDNGQGPYSLDELVDILRSICWWMGQSRLS